MSPRQLCLKAHPSLYRLREVKGTEVDIKRIAALVDSDTGIEQVKSFSVPLVLIGEDEQVVFRVKCNVVGIEIIIEVPVAEYSVVQ